MEDVNLNRPNDQLKNADTQIISYVLMLETKLRGSISSENFNKENETKYRNLQEELYLLKLQKNKSSQNEKLHKKEIQRLEAKNLELISENKRLKQEIVALQQKIQHNESIRNDIERHSPSSSNAIKNQRQQINSFPDNDNADANSVLVKGLSELQLNAIPKIVIINLGRHMKINISDKDIVKVYTMERKFYKRHNLKPDKTILIVQFRTPELKIEFLKNKEKLRLHSNLNLNDIEIIDYVSDEVYNLYQYAKILKSHGYELIYWRNNSVYAKKTRSTFCEPILIRSQNDVDTLKFGKNK